MVEDVLVPTMMQYYLAPKEVLILVVVEDVLVLSLALIDATIEVKVLILVVVEDVLVR